VAPAAKNSSVALREPSTSASTIMRWRVSSSSAARVSGSSVAAAGRAAIFIPFGAATDSHQLRNAQEMTKAGAGRLIAEPELTPGRLAQETFALLDRPAEVEALARNARSLAHPQAAREIVNLIEEAARPRGQ